MQVVEVGDAATADGGAHLLALQEAVAAKVLQVVPLALYRSEQKTRGIAFSVLFQALVAPAVSKVIVAQVPKAARTLRARQALLAAELPKVRLKLWMELVEAEHKAIVRARKDCPAVVDLSHSNRHVELFLFRVILDSVAVWVASVAEVAALSDSALSGVPVAVVVHAVDAVGVAVVTEGVVRVRLAAPFDLVRVLGYVRDAGHVVFEVYAA